MNPYYVQKAKEIMAHHGTSYFLATRFFPKEIAEKVMVLYAFVRIPDEYVDNPAPGSDPKILLTTWKDNWLQTIKTGKSVEWAQQAMYDIHIEHNIPFEYSISFIEAMLSDIEFNHPETYIDLQHYMYGSAEVVGIIMTYIVGFREGAIPYAKLLGEAMQLTNFLRDVGEDYRDRGRIYIPKEILDVYGIAEKDIGFGVVTENWRTCMQYLIAKNRELYGEANQGIQLLAPHAQKPVLFASAMYEGILKEIEKSDYDVFSKRNRVSSRGKIWCIIRTLWNKKQLGL